MCWGKKTEAEEVCDAGYRCCRCSPRALVVQKDMKGNPGQKRKKKGDIHALKKVRWWSPPTPGRESPKGDAVWNGSLERGNLAREKQVQDEMKTLGKSNEREDERRHQYEAMRRWNDMPMPSAMSGPMVKAL
jgi:hypothetical protein